MSINAFFVWCAGSDPDLLSQCPKNEQIKHRGYGMLVLIPAMLALISMSFALSTLEALSDQPILYFLGGLLWALIIFAFDRFIVSTHKRKTSNQEEIKTPTFFLRLGFAIILGIVISHPLVMLYFNGSIEDQIRADINSHKSLIADNYDQKINLLDQKLIRLDSVYNTKVKERDAQAALVALEIDGEVLTNAKGLKQTTGLKGYGPSAKHKIEHLSLLQQELVELKQEHATVQRNSENEKAKLVAAKKSTVESYHETSDYLRKELALQKLKDKHSLVSVIQWFLILLFVLIDILPLIFKTFAPYGLYDKVLGEDAAFLAQTFTESRKIYLQHLYEQLNKI